MQFVRTDFTTGQGAPTASSKGIQRAVEQLYLRSPLALFRRSAVPSPRLNHEIPAFPSDNLMRWSRRGIEGQYSAGGTTPFDVPPQVFQMKGSDKGRYKRPF